MKPSNNTLDLDQASKRPNYYKYKKDSQQVNHNRKIFQNLDSFAKEEGTTNKKMKNIGKIKRNSTDKAQGESKQTVNKQNNYLKYITATKLLANQPNMIPLKESNMSKPHLGLNKIQPSPEQGLLQKNFKRNVRSVSSHFEIQYQNLIKQYEIKKQSINHQIESLKKTQTNQIKLKYDPPKADLFLNLQTPKFGDILLPPRKVPSIKTIKSVSSSKVSKQTKWAKFVESIKVQMQFEQKLRIFKHQISSQHKQCVKAMLRTKYGIQDDIITIDTQEFDPYFQPKNILIQVISSEIANSFLCAEQNWNKSIKNNFDSTILCEIFKSFETQKQKGMISLKGFVREMGILFQNKKYLRSRDLYRIYKRIQPFTKDNFISILSKRQ